jgi:ABC-type Fe3+-hydroxamate transport system substrate-binding protein
VVTLEDVISRKPEVILTGPGVDTRFYSSSTWSTIPAVKNHRVLMYDTMVVGRPSVTLGMAAVNWANLLHPGVVK